MEYTCATKSERTESVLENMIQVVDREREMGYDDNLLMIVASFVLYMGSTEKQNQKDVYTP